MPSDLRKMNGPDGRAFARHAIRLSTVEHRDPAPLLPATEKAEDYPVEDLKGLRAPAEAMQLITQAPAAICAHAVLGVASLAVQAHVNVELPTGEVKPISLALMTVAASGERKSACDNWALRGVRERERELREMRSAAMPDYQNRLEAWQDARKEALKKSKGPDAKRAALEAIGPMPLEPLQALLLVAEPTQEGLFRLLQEGQAGIGLFTDEAGAFLGGQGMTAEARLRMAVSLSQLWDGGELRRVRAGDGASILIGRRLSIHLMAQPEVAALLLGDRTIAGAGGQGLANRFLIAAPPTSAGQRRFREPPPEALAVVAGFTASIRELLATPLPLAIASRNELAPRSISLSADAREKWIQFHDEVDARIGPTGDLGAVRGFGSRLPEHAARIAAVLTLITDIDAIAVSGAAMHSGINLARYYANETLRLTETASISPEVLRADKVLRWLVSNWSEPFISVTDLQQYGPRTARTSANEVRKLLADLEDTGHLMAQDDGAVIKGEVRREAWAIVGWTSQKPVRDNPR